MALAITNKTSGSSTSNPATTASITPTANVPLLIAVAVSVLSGSITIPGDTIAVSGCNLTWTLHGRVASWGTRRALYVFKGVGAAPTTGTLSIQYTTGGVATFEQFKWSVEEVTGADATTPFGTVYTNVPASGTSNTVTVSAAPASGDFVFASFGVENNNAPSLNSELDTFITDFGDATGTRRFVTAYDSAPDSTPTPGITWTGACNSGGLGFIVTVAAAGGLSIPVAMNSYRLRRI